MLSFQPVTDDLHKFLATAGLAVMTSSVIPQTAIVGGIVAVLGIALWSLQTKRDKTKHKKRAGPKTHGARKAKKRP